MRYLLDTAPWINGVTLPDVLPRRIRTLIQKEDRTGLCSVSLLECAILHRLGRFEIEGTLQAFFTVGVSEDIRLLELTPSIAARTNELGADFQGDPFDRVIVATASTLSLTLITTDRMIRDSQACAVEYYPFKPGRRR